MTLHVGDAVDEATLDGAFVALFVEWGFALRYGDSESDRIDREKRRQQQQHLAGFRKLKRVVHIRSLSSKSAHLGRTAEA